MEGDDIGIKSFQTEFENCIYEINVFYQKNGANEGIINIEIEKKNEDCKFKNLQINYTFIIHNKSCGINIFLL